MTSPRDWWRAPWPSSWGKPLRRPLPHTNTPLSTKAGCECIAHILQGLTDADERATVISVDGVSALMQGLMRVDGGSEAVPFVRMFMALRRSICGKIPKVSCTPSHRAREANRETH